MTNNPVEVFIAAFDSEEQAGDALTDLRAMDRGLPRDSVVNVTALGTIDKDGLDQLVSQLPEYLMQDVDQGPPIPGPRAVAAVVFSSLRGARELAEVGRTLGLERLPPLLGRGGRVRREDVCLARPW